jgi:hypothetical protein
MGGTCGTYGREEKCTQPFGGDLKEGSYFLDLAVDRRWYEMTVKQRTV